MLEERKRAYYEIDVLRGLACLVVYFSHIYLPIMNTPYWDIAGRNGVYVFFVISGFIISKSFRHRVKKIDSFNLDEWFAAFKENQQEIYLFWLRRFRRLFPGLLCLFCCLAIITLDYGLTHDVLFGGILEFFRVISNFFLLDNCMNNEYNEISRLMYWKVGIIWSLDCEIVFYMVFPLLILFSKSDKLFLCLLLFTFICKSLLYPIVEYKYLYYSLLANFDFFVAGALIAQYHERVKIRRNVLTFLVLASFYSLVFTSPAYMDYRFYLTGLISSIILVYASATNQGILRVPLLGTFLHFVGVRSYFIYLMHVITYYMFEISIGKYVSIYYPELNTYWATEYVVKLGFLCFITLLADLFYRHVELPYTNKYKMRDKEVISLSRGKKCA